MQMSASHRRNFTIGLIVAIVVGIGIQLWLYHQALLSERREGAVRLAVIQLQALVEEVQQVGVEQASAVVQEFSRRHPDLKNIRIVRGARLEASTSPQDSGEKAAPRRLSRDEKSVFDLGQKLRAAVQTNRDEGVSRKAEIEISPAASGGLLLSAPIEESESVIGYVQFETAPGKETGHPPILPALFAALIPLILFFVLSGFVKERKMILAAISFTLLVLALIVYGQYNLRSLESSILTRAKSAAAQMKQEKQVAAEVFSALGASSASPLRSSRLDVDIFRHSRNIMNEEGTINEAKVRESVTGLNDQFRNALLLTVGLCLILLGFFGFGLASRLVSTMIEHREAYAYTLPAMIGMIVLVFFPFLYGITLSFTGSTLYNTDKSIPELWVGFQNYKDILTDLSFMKQTETGVIFNYANFFWTLLFTIFWTVTNVSIGVTLGLILALILNTKGLALRPIYRVLLIFPWAMPNYITALIWKGMFHQQFGVINQVLQLFGAQAIVWFEKPFTSYLTALATNGWLSFPFMMVISLGALQSIPGDLYEAARVDGASRWQQFVSITLPSIKPALIPAIILSVVWTFNMFNIIFLVTQGEPAGSTEILITQAYKIAFEKYRYGYAAAYSTVIFMILLIYGTIQNRVTRATEAIAG